MSSRHCLPGLSSTSRSTSSPLEVSEISEDEDAIRIDMMRSFHRIDPDLDTGKPIEFSASACQKIHAELLASVNQIYLNLSESGLKTSASSSSSSLSVKKKTGTITKTKSIELNPNPNSDMKEERSSSIAEITLKKSVIRKLKKKMANSEISEEDKSNPDLVTPEEDRMKLAVLKKMKKKQVAKVGSTEEVKCETTPASSRPASGNPEPSSEDLMKAAVLRKMRKKGTKSETEESKSELAAPSRPSSGRMEVFIKQKREKRLKLP